MELIFGPTAIVIGYPWIAGVVAVALGVLYAQKRNRAAQKAAIAWGVYCVYEYLMKARLLCSGDCNIHIDMLLIWPVLLLATLLAFWTAFKRQKVAAE